MNVLIADDDALIREGLKILLDLAEGIEVVGTVSNGQEAFDFCRNIKPDIILMDIRMPVMDGVLGTKLIKETFRDIKIVILTTFRDDEYIKEAVKSGAEGYILKNQSSDCIVECLNAVWKGNTVYEKGVAGVLSSMFRHEGKKTGKPANISQREYEILELVAEGLSNREIAEKLYLSEGTTRNYVTGLLEKFELRDRTQLAIWFLKNRME